MSSAPFSFPSSKRIRGRKEFLACYEHGQKLFSAHFIFYALPSPDKSARVGITVSRKVGNAVTRNRVKRVLREFFRLRGRGLREIWIVAVAKKNAAGAGLALVDAELGPMLAHLEKSRRD